MCLPREHLTEVLTLLIILHGGSIWYKSTTSSVHHGIDHTNKMSGSKTTDFSFPSQADFHFHVKLNKRGYKFWHREILALNTNLSYAKMA